MGYWHIDDDWYLFRVIIDNHALPTGAPETVHVLALDIASAARLADEYTIGTILSIEIQFGALIAPHVPVETFLYLEETEDESAREKA